MIRCSLFVALLIAACPLPGIPAAEPVAADFDAAPADAWPLARGCPAGTGRSVARLRLPLAEGWTRRFEKTSFGAVPIVAAGSVYVGDLDGTFHALAAESRPASVACQHSALCGSRKKSTRNSASSRGTLRGWVTV